MFFWGGEGEFINRDPPGSIPAFESETLKIVIYIINHYKHLLPILLQYDYLYFQQEHASPKWLQAIWKEDMGITQLPAILSLIK